MSRYELATGAVADWLEIVRYTKQKWGATQAQRYREELDLALQQLGLAPRQGRSRERIAAGLRSFPVAQHIAFYIEQKDAIVVLRILHPRMNVDEAFKESR
jgi:toxin ParE1/3/4